MVTAPYSRLIRPVNPWQLDRHIRPIHRRSTRAKLRRVPVHRWKLDHPRLMVDQRTRVGQIVRSCQVDLAFRVADGEVVTLQRQGASGGIRVDGKL